jgi:uncharacterized protein
MKITNEFTVHTPIDHAWKLLTDLEAIAPCMPGAALTGLEGDSYKGKVKVKVGPVISEFAGTARFTEKSDADYRAAIDAKGRDARSGGNAAAVVTAVLQPSGPDSTTVSVETDLKITGKLAQFGSGMIKEVSSKLLAQFVTNLEAKLATESDASAASPAAASASAASPGTASASAASPAAASASAASPGAASTPAASPAAASVPAGSAIPAPAPADEASSATAPSAAAVETVPETAVSPAPTTPIQLNGSAPAPLNGTAPAAVNGSSAARSPASSPAQAAPGIASPAPAAQAVPTAPAVKAAPTAQAVPTAQAAPAAKAAHATEPDPEPLDLMSLAGSSVYKRLIPLAAVVVVIGAIITWLVRRN